MQDRTSQIIFAKESESKQEEKNEFCQRFTLGNIFKILYLYISFGYGIFGLIIYFMANKHYGLILAIGSVVSGSIHFFYEAYKVLYAEELLIKKWIWKNKIKLKLINSKNPEFNFIYKTKYNILKEPL